MCSSLAITQHYGLVYEVQWAFLSSPISIGQDRVKFTGYYLYDFVQPRSVERMKLDSRWRHAGMNEEDKLDSRLLLGGMTVNEKLCRIRLFLHIFV